MPSECSPRFAGSHDAPESSLRKTPAAEIARLRREAEALNEQVKLLVRTEQRLYRSQNELDTQLVRMRSLARFSGERSGDETPAEVIEQAADLVAEAIHPEWVGIVGIAVGTGEVLACSARPAAGAAVEAFAPEELQSCAAEPGPGVEDLALLDGPGARLVRRLWPGSRVFDRTRGEGIIARVPLRAGGGALVGMLLVHLRDRRRGPPAREVMGERHLAFLELLAHHVGRAIETAVLTQSLRERGTQLASSLATLEETQR